jgi:tetratricopeptide (TPR) repeat protein
VAGLRWHFPPLLGVVALSFANPHGPRALFYGLLRRESTLDNKEFQSLGKMMQPGFDLSISLFLIFTVLLALLLLWRRGEARLHEWLLFPFLLILTVVFFRFRSLFVFLLGPGLAHHLSQVKWPSRLQTWLPATVALFLMGASAALERDTYFYRFGAGIHTGVFPAEAARFLKQSGIAGKMFNTYGMGGYLIWELWPEKKVFIDGREDVYLKPGVLEEYVRCFDSRERWLALVERYGIDFAILRYPESPPSTPERSVEVLAFSRQEWALIYFDEVAAIYARRNGLNDELIRKSEIRMVQPLQLSSYLDDIARDPVRMRQFLAEIQVNMEQHPSSFRDHFTLGMLAVKRGPDHLGEAVREFEQTVEINPDFAPAYVNLGSIYRHLGRNREAERVLRKALSLEDNPLARAQLYQLRRLR